MPRRFFGQGLRSHKKQKIHIDYVVSTRTRQTLNGSDKQICMSL